MPENETDLALKKGFAAGWLAAFAQSVGLPYQELIDGIHRNITSGERICDGGKFESVSAPDELWAMFEILTGRRRPARNHWGLFSCSC